MAKRKCLSVVVCLLLLLGQNFAIADASEESQAIFMKIKHRLAWGKSVSRDEWSDYKKFSQENNCNSSTCFKDFYVAKANGYMNEELFKKWMTSKVEELFYLKSSQIGFVDKLSGSYGNSVDYNGTSFNLLTKQVISENLPWKELFLSEKYFINSSVEGILSYINQNDSEFVKMNVVGKVMPQKVSEQISVADFSKNPNFSGLFSTPRFLERFTDNELNSGRKRSSAFFRIMMCENLRPSIERKDQDVIENRISLGVTEQDFIRLHKQDSLESQHGSNPDCRKCHDRLDPAAWTMRGLRVGISPFATKGFLVYNDDEENLKKIPVASFKDLVQKTVEQDRFYECQSENFIRWIIGKDIQITQKRRAEFSKKFREINGKPKEFIRFLINTDEFQKGRSEEAINEPQSLSRAREVFSNCNECHKNMPFGNNAFSVRNFVARALERVDVANYGKNRSMPPRDHYWAPSKEDYDKIKSWVLEGAPDQDNVPLLSEKGIQKALEKRP